MAGKGAAGSARIKGPLDSVGEKVLPEEPLAFLAELAGAFEKRRRDGRRGITYK